MGCHKQEKSSGEGHKQPLCCAQEFRNPTFIDPQTCLKPLYAAESDADSKAPEPLLSLYPVKGEGRKEGFACSWHPALSLCPAVSILDSLPVLPLHLRLARADGAGARAEKIRTSRPPQPCHPPSKCSFSVPLAEFRCTQGEWEVSKTQPACQGNASMSTTE